MSIQAIPLMQHNKIRLNANELADVILAGRLTKDAHTAAKLVKRLLILITSHLRVEDEKVYPHLFEHPNSAVRQTSMNFKREMSEIAPLVVAWGERWDKTNISGRPEEFVNETRAIFKALKQRILKEEKELYPLLEE